MFRVVGLLVGARRAKVVPPPATLEAKLNTAARPSSGVGATGAATGAVLVRGGLGAAVRRLSFVISPLVCDSLAVGPGWAMALAVWTGWWQTP